MRTRRFFIAGLGRDGRIERMHVVTDPDGNSVTGAFTAKIYRQNVGETVTLDKTTTGYSTIVGGIIKLFPDSFGHSLDIELSKAAVESASFRVHYLGWEGMPGAQDIES